MSDWTLSKYREALRGAISQDAQDGFWGPAELDAYLNRAVYEIWRNLVAVDPDLYLMREDPFPLDPATDLEDGVLKVALPATMYAPQGLKVGSVWYSSVPKGTKTQFGFWVEGRNLRVNVVPPQAVNAVLQGVELPTPMVLDTDTDALPDGDYSLRGWIVPLARVFAIEKEQYQTSEEYLRLVGYIKAVIRDSYPVAQRVQHHPDVDVSDAYSGFF